MTVTTIVSETGKAVVKVVNESGFLSAKKSVTGICCDAKTEIVTVNAIENNGARNFGRVVLVLVQEPNRGIAALNNVSLDHNSNEGKLAVVTSMGVVAVADSNREKETGFFFVLRVVPGKTPTTMSHVAWRFHSCDLGHGDDGLVRMMTAVGTTLVPYSLNDPLV